MTRLKFLVFVVAAFALALFGFAKFSEHSAAGARAHAQEHLDAARAKLELRLRLAQAETTAALVAAAADPLATGAWGAMGSDAPPTQAGAEVVRGAVLSALRAAPEALRTPSWILVGNGQGVLALPPAEGESTTASDPNAFNLQKAAGSVDGAFALLQGKIFRVAAAPVRSGGEAPLGYVGAAYRLDESFLNSEASALGVSLTLIARGTALSTLPRTARAQVIGASDGPIALGALPSLGPVALPLLAGDVAPALRQTTALWGLENGTAVLTAEVHGLHTLASLQKRALAGLLALLLLAAALLIVVRGKRAAAQPSMSAAPPVEPGTIAPQPALEAGAAPAAAEAEAPAATAIEVAPEAVPEPAPVAPIGSPDWAAPPAFEALGSAAQVAEAAETLEPAAPADPALPSDFGNWPAASAEFERLSQAAPIEPVGAAPSWEAAAPVAPPPADPFAAPVPLPAPDFAPKRAPEFASAPAPGDAIRLPAPEQESTVVAAVPEQLLRAAARIRPASETPAPFPSAGSVPLPGPAGSDPDEAHFREIFEQFLATRAQCNEPAENLAYEKFAAKLRKNREALIQKYGCRSVRFQVYVKEGKAALKATPQRG